MATLIRSITRYIARWGLHYPPSGQEVQINLVDWGNAICVQTPWACLSATRDASDAQLAAALGTSFATLAEAEAHAKRQAPYAHSPHNEAIREEVLSARKYYGDLVGTYKVADKWGESYDAILAIARGERKAPRKPHPIA
jgi:hypothetical protein